MDGPLDDIERCERWDACDAREVRDGRDDADDIRISDERDSPPEKLRTEDARAGVAGIDAASAPGIVHSSAERVATGAAGSRFCAVAPETPQKEESRLRAPSAPVLFFFFGVIFRRSFFSSLA